MQTETKVMIGVAIASLLILIGGAYFYSKHSAPTSADVDPANPALLGKMENVIKASNEKAILVEFGDFECPACKSAVPGVKQLLADPAYKDKVTFIWRTFPLHGHSVLASEAAFAVKELSNAPNMFFKMGDLLFEKQDEWSTSSGATNQIDLFSGYAKSLGLDPEKFKAVLSSGKYKDVVEKDNQDALSIGTNVTPSFYINGKLVQGFNNEKIRAYLDEEIKKQ